ncbi:aldo/keto reductase [Cryptosporangium aurantiacum]|uniref:D-threo-aldose 1-dehydrogenase n=1 Tax=Cryptosporangium aurantiacum TaxID=134849 RepID=A0A1M7P7T8_9ACTN|nr:aldo/keto reductase [Cryptosporangium aurantiacum]SHN12690.1 D-threo-aldose 1-dehydrogenase [Cryptosporangium aurantiacum]
MNVVLGTAALAGLFDAVPADQARATLAEAWRLGVRSFDTAPHYGAGLAEQRLGEFLPAGARVSTKVGRLLVPSGTPGSTEAAEFPGTGLARVRDYSASGVLRSLEQSLERLGLSSVDLALVHDPDDQLDQAIAEALPALASSGLARAVGVGMVDASALARVVAASPLDYVLVAGRYTLLDRTAERELLPLCAERGVTVLAAGLLNSGVLADPRPGSRFDYAPASPEVLSAAQRMAAACARHRVPLVAAALQHAYRHPAVGAVVLGARSPAEVRDGLDGLAVPIPDELWAELDACAVRR